MSRIYANPNFHSSPPHKNKSRDWYDWLILILTVLGVATACYFSFLGIQLTKKYGDNKDQIDELKNIAQQQQEVNKSLETSVKKQEETNKNLEASVKKQEETNKNLYSLNVTAQGELTQMKGLTSVVSWEPINRLMSDREDFYINLRQIQNTIKWMTDTTTQTKEAYWTGLNQITERVLRLEKSPILGIEHWKQMWVNLSTNVKAATARVKELDSLASTPGYIGYKQMGFDIVYWYLENSFCGRRNDYRLLLNIDTLHNTDNFLRKLKKANILFPGRRDPEHPW